MEVVEGESMNDVIPRELFYKIFSVIPITSLLQLRSVCKEWCGIIDDPFFQKKHLTQEPLILIHWHSPEHGKSRLDLIKEDYSRSFKANSELQNMGRCISENSCNGLLYFVLANSCHEQQVLVCNPLTRQKLILPVSTNTESEICWDIYALGFDCSAKMFKIVRMCFPFVDDEDDMEYEGRAQVYTLGETTNSSSSWKEITKVYSPLFCEDIHLYRKFVYASGAVHWIVYYKEFEDSKFWKREIISFNFTTEEFNIIPHPKRHRVIHKLSQLVDLRGFLGVVDYFSSPTHFDIWKLKDYEKKIWVHEWKIDVSPLLKTRRRIIQVLDQVKYGEILVHQDGILFSYKQETNNLERIYALTRDTDMDISYVPKAHIRTASFHSVIMHI